MASPLRQQKDTMPISSRQVMKVCLLCLCFAQEMARRGRGASGTGSGSGCWWWWCFSLCDSKQIKEQKKTTAV